MKVWESRDLGEAKEYLGMRITRDRKKRTLTLDQCVYAEKVLKRFRMQNAKQARTPLPTGYNPKISETEATSSLCSQYQSVIGSLLYQLCLELDRTLPLRLSTCHSSVLIPPKNTLVGHYTLSDILDLPRIWFYVIMVHTTTGS